MFKFWKNNNVSEVCVLLLTIGFEQVGSADPLPVQQVNNNITVTK